MPDALDDRLRAVERALDDGSDRATSVTTTHDEPSSAQGTAPRADRTTDRIDDLEARLEDAESSLAELEAAVQALRGYAGKVRSVDERVEERADAALAAVETLEHRVEDLETGRPSSPTSSESSQDEHCPQCDGRRGGEPRADGRLDDGTRTADRRDRELDAGWPTSPAPQFDRPDDDTHESPGLVARVRDLL